MIVKGLKMAEIVKNSQQAIKDAHLKLVFSLIHEIDGISRADIKKLTKLSATTVSALADELLSENLILECGTKEASTSGRRAISLAPNPAGGHLAVVTVSEHHLRLRAYNLIFERIASSKVRLDQSKKLSEQIIDFVGENLCKVKNCGRLLGLTVGVPAIIDSEGKILSSTVLNFGGDDDLYGEISNAFEGSAVSLCNNSGLMAYAEKEFGSTEAQNLVSVDISDGVGAAVMIDGNLYTGATGMAGEFGHVSVDMCGKKCRCGSRGCLETLISVPAILERAKNLTGSEMTLSDIRENADSAVISEIMRDVSKTLAFGINNLINIIDPDAVVICGEIEELSEVLLPRITAELEKISLPGRSIPVSFTALGDDAEFKGGAKFALDRIFE